MEFININYGGGGDDSGDYSSDGVAWNDADRPPRPNIRRQDDDDPQPSTSGYGHHQFVEDDEDDEKRHRGRGQPPTPNYTDDDDDDDDDEHDRGRRRRRPLHNVDGQEGNNNGNNNRQMTPKKTRNSSGRNYFITITFLMNAVRLRHARQDFLQLFDRDDIISYCVSIERNYGTTETDDNNIRGRGRLIRIGLDGNVAVNDDDDDDANKIYHLHAYLKFKSNHFLADVREYLTSIYEDERVDVQLCRSPQNVMIYVSKEDRDLITNIKWTDLSFNYQAYRWAVRTPTFNHADPFVVRYHRNHQYLRKYLIDLKFELAREASARVRFSQKDVCYRNWTMDVCQWWNRYCCDAVRFEFKRPCLYLYGRSDVGKTTYVESLIGRHNLRYVFRPGIGNFFMQDFRADFHRVILFEEFDCKAHNLSLLRRLCEGRQHAFPVKCERDLLVAFRGPIIFVTNFDDVENEALRSRLLFVHASVPYWQSERVDVPKAEEERNDEDGGDENIIVISSTSSQTSTD